MSEDQIITLPNGSTIRLMSDQKLMETELNGEKLYSVNVKQANPPAIQSGSALAMLNYENYHESIRKKLLQNMFTFGEARLNPIRSNEDMEQEPGYFVSEPNFSNSFNVNAIPVSESERLEKAEFVKVQQKRLLVRNLNKAYGRLVEFTDDTTQINFEAVWALHKEALGYLKEIKAMK